MDTSKSNTHFALFDRTTCNQSEYIRVQEVIVTDLFTRGAGKDASDPVRKIFQVYTTEGQFLAENDSYRSFGKEHLIKFATECLNQPDTSIEEVLIKWLQNHHPS